MGLLIRIPSQPTVLDNNVGSSSGGLGLVTTITGTSSVLNLPLSPGVDRTTSPATGSLVVGAASDPATASTGGDAGRYPDYRHQ